MARVSREERKKRRLTALSRIQKGWGTGETIEYLMTDFGLTRRSPDNAIKVFKAKISKFRRYLRYSGLI